MKRLFAVLSFFISANLAAQSKPARPASGDEAAIVRLLEEQNNAWNRGDIESFMKGYWESDSLMFVGKSGVTYGWMNTLNNYKKGYPDTAAMGKLTTTNIKVKRLSKKYYFIVGKWYLKRSIGDVSGHYNLLMEKINGRWVIVADHSS
ncbi:MAG: nuclear transport factor 2 family protein [Bacteroidetes bacterium]|nr:nuclear transport factor 2 family protein [Bacteroidota bacterium]